MITGVVLKDLIVHADKRGFLMEMLRCDDSIFEGFGQVYITACQPGVAKAWHYHKKQTDHFVCVTGEALVVLYDDRTDSLTRGMVREVWLVAPPGHGERLVLLKIPPGVIHGFTAVGDLEARIVNIPTFPYNSADPDEFRHPWNAANVPYVWPPHVTRGG